VEPNIVLVNKSVTSFNAYKNDARSIRGKAAGAWANI
jgi:hypothetical protein